MNSPESKILPVEELAQLRETMRAQGRRVVQCHGCFDVVHPGHIRYLRFAKGLGDVLIVTVTGDESVGKGFDRPYVPQELRLENLAVLQFVDFVSLSEHDWGGPVLEALQPDVYVKGREYESSDDPRFSKERAIVRKHGGEVVFGSGDVVFSSTEIIGNRPEAFGLGSARLAAYCRRNGVDRARLGNVLDSTHVPKILVLGDPILDHYVFCEGASVAPETPIMSVSPVSENHFAGGGALIACQLAALGADVTFATAGATDPRFGQLAQGLSEFGVTVNAEPSPGRPVFVKRRYIVGQQKLFKVNEGYHSPLGEAAVNRLIAHVKSEGAGYDAIVATDFGYGFFGASLTDAISSVGTRVYADVSTSGQANILKFGTPRLATPTESELRFALGDMESGLSTIAFQYLHRSRAEHVVVTLGRRGCVAFSPRLDGSARLDAAYLPALAHSAVDAVGAGDLFLAGVVFADLAEARLPLGAYLGSCLAAMAVGRMGNRAVDLPDLEGFLGSRSELGA